jgi:hypothetical protein
LPLVVCTRTYCSVLCVSLREGEVRLVMLPSVASDGTHKTCSTVFLRGLDRVCNMYSAVEVLFCVLVLVYSTQRIKKMQKPL